MNRADEIHARLGIEISDDLAGVDGLVCTSQSKSHSCYVLPDQVKDGLADAFERLVSARPTLCVDQDPFELLHVAGLLCRKTLPPRIIRVLQLFGWCQGPKVLFLENLPQQRALPSTPCETGFLPDDCEMLFSDALQFGLLSTMGLTPVAHAHENEQRTFRNVVAQNNSKNSRSSWGFDVPFEAHVDNPNASHFWEQSKVNWPPVPPVLAFMGLRNEDANGRAVATSIIPLVDVLVELDDETLDGLCRPEFLISAPDSNDDNQSIKAAILVRDPVHGDHVRFDPGVTEGLTERANVALDKFKAALRRGKGRIDLRVRGGSACYFWNTQTLHQRTAFDPGPSEVARWLRRCYATPDIYAGHVTDRRRYPIVWGPGQDAQFAERMLEVVQNGSYHGMTGL